MRSPREILLERHRALEPKLEAIRQSIVAAAPGHRRPAAATSQPRSLAGAARLFRWLSVPWRELVLPSRRIWSGLAAVWILLFIINLAQRDPVSGVTGQPVQSPPVIMSWQVQQRWMNELLADRSGPPEVDRPRNATLRPRSQISDVFKT
jgi:hypothetical protein